MNVSPDSLSRNGKSWTELDVVIEALDPDDAGAVRAWLHAQPGMPVNPHALFAENEPAATGPVEPPPDDPQAIRTVGIIGGGTAGYLTALALRAWRPWLSVTLVESRDIPVIG